MIKYYCKCLNICVEIDPKVLVNENDLKLYNEIQDEFFTKLPCLIFSESKVTFQQNSLIWTKKSGPWNIYKCINCFTYSHAIKENSFFTVLNKLLMELSETEIQNMRNLIDFSPVYKVIISDSSFDSETETSRLNGKFSNDIVGLQKQLSDYTEQQSKITEENIRFYIEQQQSALKKLMKRANEDFQILTNVLMKSDEVKSETNANKHIVIKNELSEINVSLSMNISKNTELLDVENQKKSKERNNLLAPQPSFDSEDLLFPLDGMEEPNLLEEDDHSEDEPSDTDDSGSRDEGIHIPRRRSFAIAKSLPIRVPGNFTSSHVTDSRLWNKNPHYKQEHNDQPLDIAASIKALANSVHGDTIFGDLPPPRIGSRI